MEAEKYFDLLNAKVDEFFKSMQAAQVATSQELRLIRSEIGKVDDKMSDSRDRITRVEAEVSFVRNDLAAIKTENAKQIETVWAGMRQCQSNCQLYRADQKSSIDERKAELEDAIAEQKKYTDTAIARSGVTTKLTIKNWISGILLAGSTSALTALAVLLAQHYLKQ